ncbi:phosphatidylglycerophosphatase A family protein [Spirabiliibacterium falconis]|uniref:phosphatidylglycerophosphatase A family protein n=1 Tax=Spirabiliibacterium falconis TaxID=572023 RepID=UPI001AAD7DCE|nr:phosphatidylglycerophosphatase A [Spirabiliibacterium falconis]MBE2894132.1 phosphatidylglycerophosphatase A [Spirabiliibacterium falconis]
MTKRPELNKLSFKNPIHLAAIGFGAGLIYPAPGTWGTLAGWLIGVAILSVFNSVSLLILAVIAFAIGAKICGQTALDIGVHDHGSIVWDEIAAIWLVLACLPESTALWYIISFMLFRFFDILKPYPIKAFDRALHSGFGIMIDDTLAALFSLIVIYITHSIFF